jgi:hypothetical protein
MRRILTAVVVLSLLLTSAPAWAQQPQTRPRSLAMGVAGLFTLGAGIGLVSATGDTVRVLGDNFCVTERAVDYGKCSVSPESRRFGLALIGIGGVMSIFGFQHVAINPTVKGGSVSYTVRW